MQQERTPIHPHQIFVILADFKAELLQAINKHPVFPIDVIYATAILAEESGEAVRAANELVHHNGSVSDLEKELIHTGAMALRNLLHLRYGHTGCTCGDPTHHG